jgi:hypothetical protein
MSDDLKKRLQDYASGEYDMTPICADLLEAITRIEAAEAKLAKAMESIKQSIKLWEKSDGGDRERRLDNAYDGFELLCLVLADLEGTE